MHRLPAILALAAVLSAAAPTAAQDAPRESTTTFDDGWSVTVRIYGDTDRIHFSIEQCYDFGGDEIPGERLEVVLKNGAIDRRLLEDLLLAPPRLPSAWLAEALNPTPPGPLDGLEQGLEDLTRGLSRGWRDLTRDLDVERGLRDLERLLPWTQERDALEPMPPMTEAFGDADLEEGDAFREEPEVWRDDPTYFQQTEAFPGQAASTGPAPVGSYVRIVTLGGEELSGEVLHSRADHLVVDTTTYGPLDVYVTDIDRLSIE
jgi:hypothetical protein